MEDHIYKIIELNGTSKTGIEEAIQSAISKASETVRNMKWFEVLETRGLIEKDHVASWQVTIKIGFNVESPHQESGRKEAPKKSEAKVGASKYRCKICGYIYDPAGGDDSQGIKPGIPFEDLPDSWTCPECGAAKSEFEKMS